MPLQDIVQSVNVIRSKLLAILTSNQAKYLPDELTDIDVTFVNQRKFKRS